MTRYFPAFMAFYFPRAHAAIDWRAPTVFLETELAQLARDAMLGRRMADKLVQVTLHGGAVEWVLLHLEVQGRREGGFAERMFTYNYRIWDRYRRPVASLALLADGSRSWKPDSFGYRLLGSSMRLSFPVVKLSAYADRVEQLLLDDNPFGLVTAAHLLTRQTKGDSRRRRAEKRRLVMLLFQRNWDKRRIIDFLNVIDWMMRLPAELERALWNDIRVMERSDAMPYMSMFERMLRDEGRQEGRQEGWREGRQEGLQSILAALLEERFGPLPSEVRERLAGADGEQMLCWAKAVLAAPTLSAVFRQP
ncbi:transposase [Janthinobacterium fluminis]|uniref:transposase n=1 Tax=Janthinobacterium fluminis TaxID=2987524 RepID=UPI0030793656